MRSVSGSALLALLLCAFPCTTGAQWLEATIPVPDALGEMLGPGCLEYSSTGDVFYVGAGTAVFVVDGASNVRRARVEVGVAISHMAVDSVHNKLYCGSATEGAVVVVDGAQNRVVAQVPVGDGMAAMCYNASSDKLYTANDGDGTVSVIDGASHVVVATIPVGPGPRALAWSPLHNRVYCAC